MIFIDWLSIHQDHPIGRNPRFGESIVHKTDLSTGELIYECVHGHQIEGSFETSIRVRCDGTRVEVSGNPSAFNRLDNLYGLQSIDDCVDLYNAILVKLGLAPFDFDDRTHAAMYQREDGFVHFGAKITRVDLTRNFSLGSHEAGLRALRWLSGHTYQGKPATLLPNGKTVHWLNARGKGSRRLYLKYYMKEGALHASPANEFDIAYCTKLKRYVRDTGIVRQELSVKATTLREKGLNVAKNWNLSKMVDLMDNNSPHLNTGGAMSDIIGQVAPRLMEEGVTPGMATKYAGFVSLWMTGTHIREMLPIASFYRARKALLRLGIDISVPCDVSRFPVRTEEISFTEVEPPRWYRRAA